MRRVFIMVVLAATVSVAAAQEEVAEECSRYLFAYFGAGVPESESEHLRFAISRDGISWRALNNNEIVIRSDTIANSKRIRDPHILRGDHGEFLIVATDMNAYRDGWGTPNPGIVLMRSTDLVNWTHARIHLSKDYPQSFGDAFWVWAPQTIYDPDAGKYMIYFTLQRSDRKTYITYYAYANETFTGFESEPKVLFPALNGSVDNDIIKGPDGKWHLFYKGNTRDVSGREVQNGIQQAVSDKVTGPYVENFVYLDAYYQDPSINEEGSSTYKLLDSDTYILMYDLPGLGRFEYHTSTDLTTWTEKPKTFLKDFMPRHGSVTYITLSEARRMAERWPSANLDSLLVDDWVEPEDESGELLRSYSFDVLGDDDGKYKAALKKGAEIVTLADGNHVLNTGSKNGYLDLGQMVGRTELVKLKGNYTLSLDICIDASNALRGHQWAWAFAYGTNKYVAMVNEPGNGNWYYEIKNGTTETIQTHHGLTHGQWHTLTVVHRNSTVSVYIDGVRLVYGPSTIQPSSIASTISQCWLGRSPFGSDEYMRNTLMDNLRIYSKALTDKQVGELYAMRPSTTELMQEDAIQDTYKSADASSDMYNLSGQRLNHPQTGIVVVKKGKAARKYVASK